MVRLSDIPSFCAAGGNFSIRARVCAAMVAVCLWQLQRVWKMAGKLLRCVGVAEVDSRARWCGFLTFRHFVRQVEISPFEPVCVRQWLPCVCGSCSVCARWPVSCCGAWVWLKWILGLYGAAFRHSVILCGRWKFLHSSPCVCGNGCRVSVAAAA